MSPPRKTDTRWTSLRLNTFSQEQVLENMRTYQIYCPPCRLLNTRTKRLHIPHIPRALYGAGVVWCNQPCWLTCCGLWGAFPVPSLLIVKCRRRIVYSIFVQPTHPRLWTRNLCSCCWFRPRRLGGWRGWGRRSSHSCSPTQDFASYAPCRCLLFMENRKCMRLALGHIRCSVYIFNWVVSGLGQLGPRPVSSEFVYNRNRTRLGMKVFRMFSIYSSLLNPNIWLAMYLSLSKFVCMNSPHCKNFSQEFLELWFQFMREFIPLPWSWYLHKSSSGSYDKSKIDLQTEQICFWRRKSPLSTFLVHSLVLCLKIVVTVTLVWLTCSYDRRCHLHSCPS